MKDQLIYPLPHHTLIQSGKGTLVIVDNEDYKHESAQKILEGIVKALGLSIEKDVEIVTVDKNLPFNMGSTLHQYNNVLLFGVNPKNIGLQMDAKIYKIYTFEHFKMIIAHPLSYITNDLKIKQGLWKLLQMMFDIDVKSN